MTAYKQEDAPVGFISDYGLRLIKEREDIVTTVSMLHEKHGAHSIPLYTRPDNSELRKAVEEVVKISFEKDVIVSLQGFIQAVENLRAALEGK